MYWLNNPVMYPDAIRVSSARQAKYGDNRHCVGIDQSQFYLDEVAAELEHRARKEDVA